MSSHRLWSVWPQSVKLETRTHSAVALAYDSFENAPSLRQHPKPWRGLYFADYLHCQSLLPRVVYNPPKSLLLRWPQYKFFDRTSTARRPYDCTSTAPRPHANGSPHVDRTDVAINRTSTAPQGLWKFSGIVNRTSTAPQGLWKFSGIENRTSTALHCLSRFHGNVNRTSTALFGLKTRSNRKCY